MDGRAKTYSALEDYFDCPCAELRQIPGADDSGTVCYIVGVPSILLFAGHRIDSADRAEARFPAQLEPAVADEIAAALARLDALHAYGSAAAGADLLVLEAAWRCKLPTTIVLPFDPARFVEISVAPSGHRWTEKFAVAMATAERILILDGDEAQPFQATNEKSLELAARHARQAHTPLAGLAVWDYRQSEGEGGTAEAVRIWRDHGVRVETINLGELRGKTRFGI
jgi:hypothetical protein